MKIKFVIILLILLAIFILCIQNKRNFTSVARSASTIISKLPENPSHPVNIKQTGSSLAGSSTLPLISQGIEHQIVTTHHIDKKFPSEEGDNSCSAVRWLSDKEIQKIPLNEIRAKSESEPEDSFKVRPIKTREEAFDYISEKISMALEPSVACEDLLYFYFSGGVTAYPVNDFSKGILINKMTGEISTWE